VTDRELYERALEASVAAYAPYSLFLVGAAVNVENAAYPLGICAERCALGRAVVEGIRPGDVEAVAVTASPCGGCRQWLLEFGVERVIFLHDGELLVRTADELLPDHFVL
jgi:cytidine deaminase